MTDPNNVVYVGHSMEVAPSPYHSLGNMFNPSYSVALVVASVSR